MRNERGQALLEYLLLMFVVVVTITGILLSISSATERFANNYFGEYFSCLLETGELPALGGDSNPDTECDEAFEPFTIVQGRPPIPSSSTAGASQTPGSDKNASNESQDSGSPSSGASDTAVPPGSDGSFAASSGRSRSVPLSRSDGGGKTGDSANPQGFNNFQKDDFGTDGTGRSETVAAGFVSSENDDDGRSKTIAAPNPEDGQMGDTKRVPATFAKAKDNGEAKDSGFTLPDFLKFLLIVAIILAIVIFFGGQIMQYQNSQSD